MTVEAWLAAAVADAEQRGPPRIEAAARNAGQIHRSAPASGVGRQTAIRAGGREAVMISGLEGRRIADAATLLRTRRISATELVREAIARAENRRDLNAFTLLMARPGARRRRRSRPRDCRRPVSRTAARHSDHREGSRGRPRHADDGAHRRCRRRSHRPTRRSSAACAKPARSSSARPTCTNSRSGPPATRPPLARSHNPVDRTRSAGGSSGGSAAAVAHGHGIRLGRHRHRRLDSHPRRRLRHRRPEADARRAAVRRGRSPEHDARPRRAAGAIGGRRQPAVPGDEVVERSRHRAGRRRADLRRAAPVFLRSARARGPPVASTSPSRGSSTPATASATPTISGAEYTPDVYLHICLPEAVVLSRRDR